VAATVVSILRNALKQGTVNAVADKLYRTLIKCRMLEDVYEFDRKRLHYAPPAGPGIVVSDYLN